MNPAPSPSYPPLAPDAALELTVHPTLDGTFDLPVLGQVHHVAAELPEPRTLRPGAWISVSPGKPARGGLLARLFAPKSRPLALAVRCTALLLRGYREVCANDAGLAFGRAPISGA
jgi:hypothetical protein